MRSSISKNITSQMQRVPTLIREGKQRATAWPSAPSNSHSPKSYVRPVLDTRFLSLPS